MHFQYIAPTLTHSFFMGSILVGHTKQIFLVEYAKAELEIDIDFKFSFLTNVRELLHNCN